MTVRSDTQPTRLRRSSGVLLHPTSLPGPYGIGDLGPEAHRWVQALASAKQSYWQILPLGPTGSGNSPYQAYSAFAGNIALISPDWLVRDGFISKDLLQGTYFRQDRVEYEHAIPFKQFLVAQAWKNFRQQKMPSSWHDQFDSFREHESSWLEDYSLFMAIRENLRGAGLQTWPLEIIRRDSAKISELRKALDDDIRRYQFAEFLFELHWMELKNFANRLGVKIIGDVPIFVSADSADVWANADEFLLDDSGQPLVVAGVPPDYFSPTGQHWGNPLYDWKAMARSGYQWWAARLKRLFQQTDLVRLDHFRGFAQAWHIPAQEKTALNGTWVDGPGFKLFEELRRQLGELPLIAEDLGLITPDVQELRQQIGLPGMAVLQFALGGPESPHWPHNFHPNTVVYTGTHDNDTTHGWFWKLNDQDRRTLANYVGKHIEHPAWEMIRLAWSSVAVLSVTPWQDLLELGSEARMNVPGVAEGNWTWRFRPDQYKPGILDRLAEITVLYNRVTARE